MKIRRIAALILSFVMILAAVYLPASAYNEPLFDDVSPSQWFYSDVRALAQTGIISGYPDGSFKPLGNITCAEFLKLIVTAAGNNITAGVYGHWAEPYIDAALSAEILTAKDLTDSRFETDRPITRSYMAALLVRASDIEICEADNPFSDTTDVYAITASNEYLLYGYREGDSYVFKGEAHATRAEAAAVIRRMIAYREDSSAYKRDAVYGLDIIMNEAQCLDLLYYTHFDITETITFRSILDIEAMRDCYDIMYEIHPECAYIDNFAVEYYEPFDGITEYTFTFDYGDSRDALLEMRDKAEEAAKSSVASCISTDMSETDKIKAVHDYLILNCAYDYDNYLADTIPDRSYRAYGALVEHIAVCQGYSAAFNLMAKYAGIKSVAVIGALPDGAAGNHMFNAVYTGGEIFYIDVSADDPVPDRSGGLTYNNYMKTASEFAEIGYTWEITEVKIKYFY